MLAIGSIRVAFNHCNSSIARTRKKTKLMKTYDFFSEQNFSPFFFKMFCASGTHNICICFVQVACILVVALKQASIKPTDCVGKE